LQVETSLLSFGGEQVDVIILIVGRCLCQMIAGKGEDKSGQLRVPQWKFHFKGYYLGLKIKEVRARPRLGEQNANHHYDLGEDYILWAKPLDCSNEVLQVEIIKSKKLFSD